MKYLNRDISWLSFNHRVLDEAKRNIPLAERVMFHGITFSNLDEFLMTRYPSAVEESDDEALKKFRKAVLEHHNELVSKFDKFNKDQKIIIKLKNVKSGKKQKWLKHYFDNNIFPTLQPITFDTTRPIEPRMGLNIFVECYDGEDVLYNNIEIPPALPRFIRVPETNHYVAIEDIIASNIKKLIKDRKIKSVCTYSVLRSAEVYVQNTGVKDLKELIEKTLHEREQSWITRLEIGTLDKKLIKKIRSMIQTEPNTLIFSSTIINLADLKKIDNTIFGDKDRPRKLKMSCPFPAGSVFDLIKKDDRLVLHPFESYADSFVRFIEEAADDPKVISIKISLYRVADKSRIINALLKAADNGKLVTVLVELKARFDEHHNIKISKILKEGGVRLIYSSPDLKTHAKVCLVTRQEKKGVRVYSHVGTGNYNESNAKLYTDYSYFTADQDIGNDLTRFFNLLTSNQGKFKSQKIIYAPYNLRDTIIDNIDKEIKRGKDGHIVCKCNALTDDKIADKLVAAAKAGVKVVLIVRSACIIEPMKNLTICSVVGRFLEHSRIYRFGSGNKAKIYIGSADLMYRNMNLRNELMILVENPEIKKRLERHLVMYMKDNTHRRVIDSDYGYHMVKREKNEKPYDCQDHFIKEAKKLSM